jgi:phage terminase Nu1 subunit (DNA packaging protein)
MAKAAKVSLAEMLVTQVEMADILGISSRFLRKIQGDGIIETVKGKFHVQKTVRAYCDFLKSGSEKRSGNASMDAVRDERAKEIRMNRLRKEGQLVPYDLAETVLQEIIGDFNSYLSGLPSELTGDPKQRPRYHDIIDLGKIRMADRTAKRLKAFGEGSTASDAESED